MARHRRALIALAPVVAVAGACRATSSTARSPPPPAPPVIATASAPPPAPPIDAGAPPRPPRAKKDCGLHRGEISDDETPTIAGPSRSERPFQWLSERGVSYADTAKWYAARSHGFGTRDAFAEAPCFGFTVSGEDALVCLDAIPETLMQISALAIVVRKKKPVVVLDTGVIVRALDFPGSRHLDLQLAFASDMRTFELRDRAADGATLVKPPSVCEEHEKMLGECAERLESGIGDLSLCPVITDALGHRSLAPDVPNPISAYPAAVHDCAGAKKLLADTVRDAAGSPELLPAKRAAAFVDRSCAARGHWIWSGGRYVRAAS